MLHVPKDSLKKDQDALTISLRNNSLQHPNTIYGRQFRQRNSAEIQAPIGVALKSSGRIGLKKGSVVPSANTTIDNIFRPNENTLIRLREVYYES